MLVKNPEGRNLVKIGVVGGTGYTGVELIRLLALHPKVELSLITSRGEAGTRIDNLFPNLRGAVDLHFEEPDLARLKACDLVFFATPNGIAMTQVPELLAAGVRVIDLAADFRLKSAETWAKWYGQPHACPHLLEEAVYGLPEINRDAIRNSRLVANPGCYPTAVQLGLAPLLVNHLIDPARVIADVKSGVSGAGRGANVQTLLCETTESFKAYGVSGHRHHPEIRQGLEVMGGNPVGLTFVPHLVPMVRGIEATLYVEPCESFDPQAVFEAHYSEEPFVDVMPAGSLPETRTVKTTNLCRLALHRQPDSNHLIIVSVIDNLVKGAAGQAIQNMNLMLGFAEGEGLTAIAPLP